MNSISLRSPAKINLFLEVCHKRDDGFHEINTLFHRISLADKLQIQVEKISNATSDIRITTNHSDLPTDQRNIAFKAAQLFLDHWQQKDRVHIQIDIDKKIPIAAGLAGGSSNAATVLLGLNQVLGQPFGFDQLCRMGEQIGSDVNFFLFNVNWAWGRGRGEQIQPLNCGLKMQFLLVTPQIPLLAANVYKSLNLKLTKDIGDVNILLNRYLMEDDFEGVTRCFNNHLESAIFVLCPTVLDLKKRLRRLRFRSVLVSGSGPSVFAVADCVEMLSDGLRHINKDFPQSFIVKTA